LIPARPTKEAFERRYPETTERNINNKMSNDFRFINSISTAN
jgi:hypothetical protein